MYSYLIQEVRRLVHRLMPNSPMDVRSFPKTRLMRHLGFSVYVEGDMYAGQVGVRGDWEKSLCIYQQEADLVQLVDPEQTSGRIKGRSYELKYSARNLTFNRFLHVFRVGNEYNLVVIAPSEMEVKKIEKRLHEIGRLKTYKADHIMDEELVEPSHGSEVPPDDPSLDYLNYLAKAKSGRQKSIPRRRR